MWNTNVAVALGIFVSMMLAYVHAYWVFLGMIIDKWGFTVMHVAFPAIPVVALVACFWLTPVLRRHRFGRVENILFAVGNVGVIASVIARYVQERANESHSQVMSVDEIMKSVAWVDVQVAFAVAGRVGRTLILIGVLILAWRGISWCYTTIVGILNKRAESESHVS